MKKKLTYLSAAAGFLLFIAALYSYAPPTTNYGLGAPGGSYTNGSNPVWTTDSVTIPGTGSYTITANMPRGYATNNVTNNLNSITFSNDLYNATAITPTLSTMYSLYASANNGVTYGTAPIYTYTMVPNDYATPNKPKTVTYLVNSPYGGLPYTNFKWVVQGAHSSCTIATRSSILIR